MTISEPSSGDFSHDTPDSLTEALGQHNVSPETAERIAGLVDELNDLLGVEPDTTVVQAVTQRIVGLPAPVEEPSEAVPPSGYWWETNGAPAEETTEPPEEDAPATQDETRPPLALITSGEIEEAGPEPPLEELLIPPAGVVPPEEHALEIQDKSPAAPEHAAETEPSPEQMANAVWAYVFETHGGNRKPGYQVASALNLDGVQAMGRHPESGGPLPSQYLPETYKDYGLYPEYAGLARNPITLHQLEIENGQTIERTVKVNLDEVTARNKEDDRRDEQGNVIKKIDRGALVYFEDNQMGCRNFLYLYRSRNNADPRGDLSALMFTVPDAALDNLSNDPTYVIEHIMPALIPNVADWSNPTSENPDNPAEHVYIGPRIYRGEADEIMRDLKGHVSGPEDQMARKMFNKRFEYARYVNRSAGE